MIISVAHDKGGVGKTTISTNIITMLSRAHEVSAVDLDPKHHLSTFLKRRGDPKIKQLSYKGTKDLVAQLEKNEGILIADVGGLDSDLTRYMIAYSDLVITPLADSQIEIDGLMQFKEVIKSLQSARADLRATVLLNRIHPMSNKTVTQLREYIAAQPEVFNMFDTVIRDRAAYKNAYSAAQGVYEYGDAKASTEIHNLIQEITQWLK